MTEPQATDKDSEAVRSLQMYFRRSPSLVWQYGASDEDFLRWVRTILKVIRDDDMEQVKQLLENEVKP
jgi:hypothetical protein